MPSPCRIYFAVPGDRRQAFADCFSGMIEEASITLIDKITNDWWWGAVGYYDLLTEVDKTKLAVAQAWYCCVVFNIAGFDRPEGLILESNCGFQLGQPDPGYHTFLEQCGLVYQARDVNDNHSTSAFIIPSDLPGII